jgi:DNA polymerase-3 subunit gamma/tau
MQLALYRAERPEYFEDIIGQKHIVKILQNQLRTGSVSQAYLFAGTRGTGKTTTARILAKAVNCIGDEQDGSGRIPCGHCPNCEAISRGSFLDVIELDAASNNGVEDLRQIIDSVQFPPVVGKYKVYIIDEVHMLSQAAENAFLKTLEEPPEYAIFILATTDPEKVRQTIRSRCMTLNFKRISEVDMRAGMKKICDKKGVAITEDALGTIAEKADGSVRDGLSILDQCISTGESEITSELVLDYVGSAGSAFYISLTDAVSAGDTGRALTEIDSMIREGKDARQLIADWLTHYRDLLVARYVEDPHKIVNASGENIERIREQSKGIPAAELDRAIRMLSEAVNLGRYSTQPRILLETVAIRLAAGDIAEAAPAKPAAPPKQAAAPKPKAASRPVTDTRVQRAEPEAKPEQAAPQSVTASPQAESESDDLGQIWDRIIDEVTREDFSFRVVIGNNSRIEYFRDDEIRILVKRNKIALAENSRPAIERAVKSLYGDRVYVSLQEADLEAENSEPAGRRTERPVPEMTAPESSPEAPDIVDVPDEEPAETAEEQMEEDIRAREIAEDARTLFGDIDIKIK